MKFCVLLSALLVLGCAHVRVNAASAVPGSCDDASALGAAKLALGKINQDRTEGYRFELHRLSNVHTHAHGEAGIVFYLNLDVVETNCTVLITDDSRSCAARELADTPVYGRCKVAIYISKVHRVVRLYKYNCAVRPAPASKLVETCPDCPTLVATDGDMIKETVSLAVEKFNKESGLTKRFALLKVERASSGMAMDMYYNAEFLIQETTCGKDAAATDACPMMNCEFSHKGFCTASMFTQSSELEAGKKDVTVNCEIFETEAADGEKKLHLLGGETDHSHTDTHAHDDAHDHAHASDPSHTHDHAHDHTKSHADHDHTHQHDDNSDHHHTHDHAPGSTHRHAHAHSHDHGHGHDHVHTHHAKAHNHSGDFPSQHHDYKHTDGVHTHEHDHEIALDHDHKHAHLHEHEHHHHHHEHEHETTAHDHPEGEVRMLPSMDRPMTLPAFPDVPAAGPEVGVALPLKQDPQIPGVTEPLIEPYPATLAAGCPPAAPGSTLVEKLFAEDPEFKAPA